jgi:GABA permease
MWAYPYLTYVAILGMLAIVLAMAFIPDQRTPLLFGFISLAILLLAFGLRLRLGGQPQMATLNMEAHRYEEL